MLTNNNNYNTISTLINIKYTGIWSNGMTLDSRPRSEGSIPSTPANSTTCDITLVLVQEKHPKKS